MLIGTFEHTLDTKGRINVPAKFREDFGDRFIITRGLDNCIAMYSLAEWKVWEDKLKALPDSKARNLKRFFFAGATEAEPDKQGRIVLPPMLRKYASLDQRVVVIGANDRAEIWDADRWYQSETQMTSESMAEEMENLDF